MIKVLPHNGVIGSEIRPLYFYRAMGMDVRNARIISFGACNFACPYCKRDGAFRDKCGDIINAADVTLEGIFCVCDDAHAKGQVVRLSGGDPVVFPQVSLAIAKYMWETYGAKISMAHNGSSPEFARKMAPYLESAAIDLKAVPVEFGMRSGLAPEQGERMYGRALQTQDMLSDAGVMVDIRTPVFATTTLDDMLQLAGDIVKGGRADHEFWTWRMYSPVRGCDWQPPHKEAVIWMIGEVKKVYPDLKIGLRAKWEPNGFMYF
jgi:pyruvate formate lyase activating enzyme